MLGSLFEILSIDTPRRVEYLGPLIDLANAQGSLTVATLNYDRAIENVAQARGIACDTGIETWLSSGSLAWGESGIQLLKLHGSIDWVADTVQQHRDLPMQRIHKVEDPAEKRLYEAPAIVFGEAGKLRAEGPYLELLLAWAAHLQNADRLLVCGYSFRDPHVNEIIARWFNDQPDRKLVILNTVDFLEHQPRDSFAWQFRWVNRDEVGNVLTSPRIMQVVATTAQGLSDAIDMARDPITPSP